MSSQRFLCRTLMKICVRETGLIVLSFAGNQSFLNNTWLFLLLSTFNLNARYCSRPIKIYPLYKYIYIIGLMITFPFVFEGIKSCLSLVQCYQFLKEREREGPTILVGREREREGRGIFMCRGLYTLGILAPTVRQTKARHPNYDRKVPRYTLIGTCVRLPGVTRRKLNTAIFAAGFELKLSNTAW